MPHAQQCHTQACAVTTPPVSWLLLSSSVHKLVSCPMLSGMRPDHANTTSERFDSETRSGAGGWRQMNQSYEQQHMRRSEEHTSELQSLMRTSYADFCLKKKTPEIIQN